MGYFDQIETAAKLKKEEGDPCWPGYCQRGTKMKDGKEVPNCVPIETAAETFTPPPAVAKQAARGLELRKANGGKGGTNIGVGRAGTLAKRKPVSLAIIKRMKAYFDRHQVDKKGKDWGNKANPSKGKIAWLLWGGDAGYSWAKGILRKAETASSNPAQPAAYALFNALSDGPMDTIDEASGGYVIRVTMAMSATHRFVDEISKKYPGVKTASTVWRYNKEEEGTTIYVRPVEVAPVGSVAPGVKPNLIQTAQRLTAAISAKQQQVVDHYVGRYKGFAALPASFVLALDNTLVAKRMYPTFLAVLLESTPVGDAIRAKKIRLTPTVAAGLARGKSEQTPADVLKVLNAASKHPQFKDSVRQALLRTGVSDNLQRAVETASLVDAISDLAEAIREGVTPADAVKEVAEEYGLNPVLLRRKFEEQHKASPEDYATKSAETKQNKVMLADAPLRDAQNTAREQYRTGFRPGGPGEKLVGKPFQFKGEQYVFVAVTNASYPVVAVRVRGNQPMNLKGNIQAIMDQVRAETAGDDKGDDKGGGEDKDGNLHVQQHHLTNNIFIRRAKQQADQLGLHWEGAFDPNGVPGLGRHNIRVSGQAEALEAFKNWCKGNMPKEDVDIETKEIAAMKPTVGDVLKALKAETAAKAKGKPDWKEGLTKRQVDQYEKIAKAVGDFTGADYHNWMGEDGVGSTADFKRFNKAVYKFLGDDLAHDAEQLARLDYFLAAAVADKKPRQDSLVGQLYAEWKRRQGKGEKASVASVLNHLKNKKTA